MTNCAKCKIELIEFEVESDPDGLCLFCRFQKIIDKKTKLEIAFVN